MGTPQKRGRKTIWMRGVEDTKRTRVNKSTKKCSHSQRLKQQAWAFIIWRRWCTLDGESMSLYMSFRIKNVMALPVCSVFFVLVAEYKSIQLLAPGTRPVVCCHASLWRRGTLIPPRINSCQVSWSCFITASEKYLIRSDRFTCISFTSAAVLAHSLIWGVATWFEL